MKEGWTLERHSWHFHRRLFERYGITLEYGDYSRIITAIRDKRSVLVRRKWEGTQHAAERPVDHDGCKQVRSAGHGAGLAQEGQGGSP